MFNLPTQPQSVVMIIRYSFMLWWSSLRNLFVLSLIAIFVGILPHFFVSELNSFDLHVILQFIHRNYFFFAVYFIIAAIFLSVILSRLYLFTNGINGSLTQAFLIALKRLPYILSASFLAAFLVGLGSAFFLIPGIYVLILIAFYQPLVLTENYGPIQALRKSCELVYSHWWHVFGVFALTSLVFHFILTFIELSLIEVIKVSDAALKIRLSYGLLRLIINSLYYPFLCCIQLVLLHDLKLRQQTQQENAEENNEEDEGKKSGKKM
jgi:hypothetical protein